MSRCLDRPARPRAASVLPALLACIGMGIEGCAPAAAPPPAAPTASRPTTTTEPDVRRLVLDAAAADACGRLRGRVLGLPGEGPASDGLTGADGGLAPSAGRLLIRDCEARLEAGALRLRIGGPGWQWVDRQQLGFRVRQYVYFTARADLKGDLDVGYDPATKLASIWLTPSSAVDAEVTPVGDVNAHPESFVSWIGGVVVTPFAGSPSTAARAKVATEGAEQLRKRLASGATITYDLEYRQFDVLLGQLPKGTSPRRPFAGSEPWLLNEAAELHPGGYQLSGPFPGDAPVLLDREAREGRVELHAVCEADANRAIDALMRGERAGRPEREGGMSAVALAADAPTVTSTTVTPPACPWMLVASTKDETAKIALRLRAKAAPGGPGSETVPASTPGGQIWVRPTLMSFDISPKNPKGQAWDAFGGAPDPEIWIGTGRENHLVVRKMQDTFRADPMATGPILEVTATSPIIIKAYDVDTAVNDFIGEARITLDDIQKRGPEIVATLELGGARTGSVRVRVEIGGK